MNLHIKGITPEMTKTVNRLLENDFKDATADEIKQYAEFVKLNALQSAEFEDNRAARESLVKADIENNKRESEAAITALEALTELAQAKLKAVEGGVNGEISK